MNYRIEEQGNKYEQKVFNAYFQTCSPSFGCSSHWAEGERTAH